MVAFSGPHVKSKMEDGMIDMTGGIIPIVLSLV